MGIFDDILADWVKMILQVADKIFVRGQIFCPGVKGWTNNLSADKLFHPRHPADKLFRGDELLHWPVMVCRIWL